VDVYIWTSLGSQAPIIVITVSQIMLLRRDYQILADRVSLPACNARSKQVVFPLQNLFAGALQINSPATCRFSKYEGTITYFLYKCFIA